MLSVLKSDNPQLKFIAIAGIANVVVDSVENQNSFIEAGLLDSIPISFHKTDKEDEKEQILRIILHIARNKQQNTKLVSFMHFKKSTKIQKYSFFYFLILSNLFKKGRKFNNFEISERMSTRSS